MLFKSIIEALSKEQERDAYRMTHGGSITDTTPSHHEELSKEWREKRDAFLEKFPQAKIMFQKGGGDREYQFRVPNVLNDNEEMSFAKINPEVFASIIKCLAKLGEHNGTLAEKWIKRDEPNEQMVLGFQGIFNRWGTKVQSQSALELRTEFRKFVHPSELNEFVKFYVKGIIPYLVKTNNGNKIGLISIGKLLARFNGEQKLFNEDPIRTGKGGSYDMIVTGHPIDIYGGSTNRGWKSCYNVNGKEFCTTNPTFEPDIASRHMHHDINNHIHMVYLVTHGGNTDHNAVARIAFKLKRNIESGAEGLFSESTVYGTAPAGFKKAAEELMSELFPIEAGVYAAPYETYHDVPDMRIHGGADGLEDVSLTPELYDTLKRKFATDEDEGIPEFVAQQILDSSKPDEFLSKIVENSVIFGDMRHHIAQDVDSLGYDLNEILDLHNFINDRSGDYELSNYGFEDQVLLIINSKDTHVFNNTWESSVYFRDSIKSLIDLYFDDCEFEDGFPVNEDIDGFINDLDNFSRSYSGEKVIISIGTLSSPDEELIEKANYLFGNGHFLSKLFSLKSPIAKNDSPSELTKLFKISLEHSLNYSTDIHAVTTVLEGVSNMLSMTTDSHFMTLDWLLQAKNNGDVELSSTKNLQTPEQLMKVVLAVKFKNMFKYKNGELMKLPGFDQDKFNSGIISLCSKTQTTNVCKNLVGEA